MRPPITEIPMRRIAFLLAAVLLAGCYHVTVVTVATPGPTTIDQEWQSAFVAGLVPPPELDVKDRCPHGVAKVETERTFLNGLASYLTVGIYTPMHTKVTCGA